MQWKDKSVLVTGGAGFIGSHLVDKLLELGAKVTVIDNLERGKSKNLQHCLDQIDFWWFDLREQFPPVPRFSVVFDLAAKVWGIRNLYNQPASLMSDNIKITLNVIDRCRDAEKYVYLSSSCVYDHDQAKVPHKEDDMGIVNSFYGWSKVVGETLCEAYRREFDLNYTIARPFNVYGPRESFNFPHVIPDFIKRAKQIYPERDTFKILGNGEQTRSFTYITDLVDGLILCAEKGKCEAYNLGSEEETRIIDLAKLILEICQIYPKIEYVPPVKGDVQRRCASSQKAKRELGWTPKVSLREGLQKTIEWYEQNVK